MNLFPSTLPSDLSAFALLVPAAATHGNAPAPLGTSVGPHPAPAAGEAPLGFEQMLASLGAPAAAPAKPQPVALTLPATVSNAPTGPVVSAPSAPAESGNATLVVAPSVVGAEGAAPTKATATKTEPSSGPARAKAPEKSARSERRDTVDTDTAPSPEAAAMCLATAMPVPMPLPAVDTGEQELNLEFNAEENTESHTEAESDEAGPGVVADAAPRVGESSGFVAAQDAIRPKLTAESGPAILAPRAEKIAPPVEHPAAPAPMMSRMNSTRVAARPVAEFPVEQATAESFSPGEISPERAPIAPATEVTQPILAGEKKSQPVSAAFMAREPESSDLPVLERAATPPNFRLRDEAKVAAPVVAAAPAFEYPAVVSSAAPASPHLVASTAETAAPARSLAMLQPQQENFAGSGAVSPSLPVAEKPRSSKSFVSTSDKELTERVNSLGTAIAKPAAFMLDHVSTLPTPHPVVEYTEVVAAGGVTSGMEQAAESATAQSAPAEAISEAHRAVEVVLRAVDQVAGRERSSVTLDLSVGDAPLSVRVELRADEVTTTFTTESSELRAALAQEWQSMSAGASERNVRLAAPVFTGSDSSLGDASTGQQGSGQSDRQGARNEQPAQPGWDRRFAGSVSSSHAAEHAADPLPLHAFAPAGTAQRLNLFA